MPRAWRVLTIFCTLSYQPSHYRRPRQSYCTAVSSCVRIFFILKINGEKKETNSKHRFSRHTYTMVASGETKPACLLFACLLLSSQKTKNPRSDSLHVVNQTSTICTCPHLFTKKPPLLFLLSDVLHPESRQICGFPLFKTHP